MRPMLGLMTYLETGIRNNWWRWKGRLLKTYLAMHGCKVGKGLKCVKLPAFRTIPHRNITFGDHVTIGIRISFDVNKDAQLKVHDHVNLTQDIVISANAGIEIGEGALIAENVSIRDSDHRMAPDELIVNQGLDAIPVTIGNDVWIAAGCTILKGSHIGEGAVIGANSLVTANSAIEAYGIYAGSPAILIRKRN